MDNEKVKEVIDITQHLGRLIVSLDPQTGPDWDAMEKMQAAHKQLRGIDPADLMEQAPRAGFTK